jgi:hypothetical protein
VVALRCDIPFPLRVWLWRLCLQSLFGLPTVAASLFFPVAFALRHGSKKKDAKWRVACTLRSVASGRCFFFLFCFFLSSSLYPIYLNTFVLLGITECLQNNRAKTKY